MNVAIDYSFLSFPIETLLAVLVVSSRSLLKIGWRPKVLAVGLFISIVGAYFAVALLGGALVLACQPLHALVFPMRCVLYVVYACLLAGIVRELYEVSAIEAFLYTVMGYGLQHLVCARSAVHLRGQMVGTAFPCADRSGKTIPALGSAQRFRARLCNCI